MATHWVDITDGSDSNGGTSYVDAVQTLPKAHDLLEADTDTAVVLNIVNSGTYNLTANTTETYVSTGTTSQTFTLRGVDSAGDPALVTVESLAVGTSQRFFQFWRGNVIYENLFVDYSPSTALTGTQFFHDYAGTGDIGDLTFNYCHFRAYPYGSVGANQPSNQIWDPTAGRTGEKSVNYCVFENMAQGVSSPVSFTQTGISLTVDHCIFLDKYATHNQKAPYVTFGIGAPTGDTFVFTNNMMIAQYDPDSGAAKEFVTLNYNSNGVMDECTIHDNVVFIDNIGGSNDATLPSGIFYGMNALSPTITATSETIGYNVMYTGVDFPVGDIVNGVYVEGIFEGLAADPVATDSVSYGSADEDTLFLDMASTYSWEQANGVTLTVPADCRLILETDSGTGGAVPGALPSGGTDYTVTVAVDDSTPNTGQTIVVTTTVANSGINATDVVVANAVPSGLTYVSHTGDGSYVSGTGVWTAGSVNSGASASIAVTCTVDTDQQGNSIDWTATFTSGSPGASSPTDDDTDTQTITVNAQSSYVVATKTGAASPREGETVTVSVAVRNDGLNATGVTVSAPVPSGGTFVSSSTVDGTYDSETGVWTIGALNDADAANLTLAFLIKAGQAGNTLTFTATLLTSTPQSWPDTSDDTDSETINVVADDPSDPGSPASIPYLDVLPIYTTDLKMSLNAQMKTKKNRQDGYVLRGDVEDVRWREGSMRCIDLGTNLTTKVILGGIQRGEYLFMESTTEIQISVGNDTNLYFPAKMVVLGSGDFEQVHLKNTSTTVSATVIIGVTD